MTVTVLPFTGQVDNDAVRSNFEYIESHGLFMDDNLASLVSRVAALTNLGIARGTGTVVFTASNGSAFVNIPHGLNGTPVAAVGTPFGGAFGLWIDAIAKDGTNIQWAGVATSVITGSFGFTWMAIL